MTASKSLINTSAITTAETGTMHKHPATTDPKQRRTRTQEIAIMEWRERPIQILRSRGRANGPSLPINSERALNLK